MIKNIDEIGAIELALVIEEEGAKFYADFAQKEEGAEVKEIFLKLADDEAEHIKTLEGLREEVIKNKFSSYEDKYMIGDFLKEVAEKGIFSQKGKSAQMSNKVKTAPEALKVGIEAEQGNIDFYSRLAKGVNTASAIKVFNALNEIEKEHLKILNERLANLWLTG